MCDPTIPRIPHISPKFDSIHLVTMKGRLWWFRYFWRTSFCAPLTSHHLAATKEVILTLVSTLSIWTQKEEFMWWLMESFKSLNRQQSDQCCIYGESSRSCQTGRLANKLNSTECFLHLTDRSQLPLVLNANFMGKWFQASILGGGKPILFGKVQNLAHLRGNLIYAGIWPRPPPKYRCGRILF